jgi:ribonuclease BN (tRNA processing enzyme)
MVLMRLDNGQNILIDINIRGKADDDDDDTSNVAEDLKGRLERDDQGRLYVDAFLVSHPHSDHITGLRNHFHLGSPDSWDEDDDPDSRNVVVPGRLSARRIKWRATGFRPTLPL